MHTFHKKNLTLPLSAKAIHEEIVTSLENLIKRNIPSPLHPDFRMVYDEILIRFSQYQHEVVKNYGKMVTCKKGCTYCCSHWVEDVYSFEAEIIASYIKEHFSERVNAIITKFREDEKELIKLNDIMEQKLIENRMNKEISDIDSTDLLLASYYQLRRPCALLIDEERCSIYETRPLTCRIYISFSDPRSCRAEYINESNIPTYLLDVEESASKLLDTLHERYDRYSKSGLQALLIDYLQE
jgi:Fe-S-cluster containining protein